jgi:hypothetical protein
LIAEKPGSRTELPQMLESLTDAFTAATLFPTAALVPSPSPHVGSSPKRSAPPASLKRWRGAEQQVLAVLQAWGWKAEDVSRQNIGYDIEARTPEGEEVFIEVKSVDYVGQPFTLASNEESGRETKEKCVSAGHRAATNSHLEIFFLRNPANSLKMTRQCRQWVWECAEYEYSPERLVLEVTISPGRR